MGPGRRPSSSSRRAAGRLVRHGNRAAGAASRRRGARRVDGARPAASWIARSTIFPAAALPPVAAGARVLARVALLAGEHPSAPGRAVSAAPAAALRNIPNA